MKVCRKCRASKPLSEFYSCKDTKDGRVGCCKKCFIQSSREWALKNLSRRKKTERLWKRNNPERVRKSQRAYGLRKYGITESDFIALATRQDNRCAICRELSSQAFHVDHCHTTGKVRGLLCNRCNRGLGFFRDCANLLVAAQNYLSL